MCHGLLSNTNLCIMHACMIHKLLFKSNLWHIGAWDVAKMRKTARTVPGCLMSEKEHYLNAQCDRTRLK